MKKTVKPLVLLTICALFFTQSPAQLKMPVAAGISSDIKKIIEDYPKRFINLMGEVITRHTQSTDYACNFKVNGAEESFITRYSAKKEVCRSLAGSGAGLRSRVPGPGNDFRRLHSPFIDADNVQVL